MKKAIKILVGAISGLVLLLLAGIVAVIAFINPNDYKPQITQKVHQHTGRQLTLQGDIGWTFFPSLGLQINQAQLSNAPGFGDKPFATIQKADISVALLPLLKGQVELGKVTLSGLELYLIKNSNGITNWQDLSAAKENKKPLVNKSRDTETTGSKSYFSSFALAGADINDGHIVWQDNQAKKSYDISKLQLHSGALKSGESFPVKSSFILKNDQSKMNINVQSDVTIDLQKKILNLNTLKFKVDDNTLTGTVTVNDFTDNLRAQGQFQIDSLQLGKFNPTDVSLQFKMANNVIDIKPITAKIYQGTYNGSVNLDTRGVVTKITSNIQLQNIQVESFFHEMSGTTRLQLTGVGNFSGQFTTQGDQLINHLSGQGKLALANGILKGINIPYWIDAGKSLIHKELPPAQSGPNQTDFGNLTATFVMTNGIARNNDLLLRSARLEAKGKGTVDLVNQQLDYQLDANLLRSNGQQEGTIIPLRINGPFSDIKIRPAVDELVKEQIKEKIKEKLNDELGDKLKDKLNSLFK